jgi:hypothetical protein
MTALLLTMFHICVHDYISHVLLQTKSQLRLLALQLVLYREGVRPCLDKPLEVMLGETTLPSTVRSCPGD